MVNPTIQILVQQGTPRYTNWLDIITKADAGSDRSKEVDGIGYQKSV